MGSKNKFHQIFELVARANGLREIDDNVYVDPGGDYFYLDKYGFHTQNQLSNLEIIKQKRILHKRQEQQEKLLKQTKLMEQQDLLSQRSRKKIRKILNREELPDQEKVRLLKINMKIKGSLFP